MKIKTLSIVVVLCSHFAFGMISDQKICNHESIEFAQKLFKKCELADRVYNVDMSVYMSEATSLQAHLWEQYLKAYDAWYATIPQQPIFPYIVVHNEVLKCDKKIPSFEKVVSLLPQFLDTLRGKILHTETFFSQYQQHEAYIHAVLYGIAIRHIFYDLIEKENL